MFPFIKIINTFTKICLVYISNLNNQSYNINNNPNNNININKYSKNILIQPNNSNNFIPPKNFYFIDNIIDKKKYNIDYIFLLD
jgi:hypothetical protein